MLLKMFVDRGGNHARNWIGRSAEACHRVWHADVSILLCCGTVFDDVRGVSSWTRIAVAVAVFAGASLVAPARVAAYSVLAHEATVDAAWKDTIAPLLRQKFSRASADDLLKARAYAYGGSLIQDLGYYPFGSKLFSNLVHYVRAGDFVEALVAEARDINEYAFALGAIAHYCADTLGHSIAVNHAVPLMYPKLRDRFGDEVIYVDSPKRHVMVEFAFDVSQMARGAYLADAYHDLIGFDVATPLLDRAFRRTYGLDLASVFGDVDLAVGTYRRAVSETIPEMTLLAWKDKREEIEERTPGIQQSAFVFTMTRQEYERAYGVKYRKPGFFSRLIVAIFKVIPKFGPFRPLAFEPLTAEAEKLFTDSFAASQKRYLAALRSLQAGRLNLVDMDLDTGRPPAPGENELADETFTDLEKTLAKRKIAAPPALRAAIERHRAVSAGSRARSPRE